MCPEEKIPAKPLPRPWETCQTMNGAWGFDSSKVNNYKSPDTLIHELEAVVSRDGNYLLNIGLQGDGSLTEKDIYNLTEIGKWMDLYGKAIYGTTRCHFPEPSWGYYTQKSDTHGIHIYCHVTQRHNVKYIEIPLQTDNTVTAFDMSQNQMLQIQKRKQSIRITLPKETTNPYSYVIDVYQRYE